MDAWSDKVDMVKNKPVALISEREKMPFEVTPFLPYLTYYSNTPASSQADKSDAKPAEATTQQPAADPEPQAQPQPQPQD
jgi:hypothetical protein